MTEREEVECMAGDMSRTFDMTDKERLRREKIDARNALTAIEREELSERICKHILGSERFKRAKTVMLYKATRGEVRLDALETVAETMGKKLCYPLCVSDGEMIALSPKDEKSWTEGYYGILEPIRERSEEIQSKDIDLVICPCTVFDEQGERIGMGAGFYDRFLSKCNNAVIVAVAFECQRTKRVPTQKWDIRMDKIYTEK